VRIVIAGGTGFLGRALARALASTGHEVVVLTRRNPAGPDQVTWTPDGTSGSWAAALDGADAVVNLTGESIAGARWTETRKRILLDSRVLPTRSLAAALPSLSRPPKLVVQGSAVGYYGARGEEPITESSDPGHDFLARTAIAWEASAAPFEQSGIRVVVVRTGLVLAADGGVLQRMLPPFRFGAGGPFGDGRAMMPWIHRADWVRMVEWILTLADATGPFNASAPEPVSNERFTATLARVLHRPAFVRVPAFALRLALGELADAVLTGQAALPARALALGFRFSFPSLEPALVDVLRR
jgi:uncharacterized protein (TIGR01777 family)